MLRVARALRDVSGAANVDYEIHGDSILHLRTHLFARQPTRPATRAQLAEAIEAGSPSHAASTADVVAVYDDMSTSFEHQLANGFYNVHYDRPTVLDLCGDVSGLHLAELGCGPGFYLAELREREPRLSESTPRPSCSHSHVPGSARPSSCTSTTSSSR